jgi:cytoskeletal protein CcmA (bactofilin family)
MTHIGPAVTIVGDVECDAEDLIVDGCVRGRLQVRNVAVTVGPQGRIEGDIRGRLVTIEGRVDGSIWASERIELTASAVVYGSLSANRIIIPDGAIVNGRIDMDQRTIAAAVARFKAEQTGVVA